MLIFDLNTQLMKPRTGIAYNKLRYPLDNSRNLRIINELRSLGNYEELSVQVEDTLSNISFGVDAEKAESAFYRIGQLLGYMCQRPDKEIRRGPDVLWCTASNTLSFFQTIALRLFPLFAGRSCTAS